MWLLSVCLFAVTGLTVASLRGSSCTTPNGESAKCIALAQCNVIRDAIITRDSEALQFAQKSQCGYDSEPLVCCGSSSVLHVGTGSRLSPLLPEPNECGFQDSSDDKVLGGEITKIGEHPWMVLLHYRTISQNRESGFKCGGTLINNRYVLTAAHCVNLNGLEIDFVRLGEWQISNNEDCLPGGLAIRTCSDPVVDVDVAEKIVYPNYVRRTGEHDIALLRLSRSISKTKYIRPICLPQPNAPVPSVGANLTTVGWGATETASSSDYKLKVNIPVFPKERCSSLLSRYNRVVSDRHLCAGGIRGKDSCNGDSGGPLLGTTVVGGKQWYQEGIVSWGLNCGLPNIPAIYTRVSTYTNWIVDKIRR